VIYAIKINEYIKIGWSNNPQERIKSIQTGSPYKVMTMAVLPGDSEVENALHNKFKKYRTSGEWFTDPDKEIERTMLVLMDIFSSFQPNKRTKVLAKTKAAKRVITSKCQCNDCGKMFSTKQALNAHRRFCDGEYIPEYECQRCERQFGTVQALNAHQRFCVQKVSGVNGSEPAREAA